ncbi:MAG: hypothetical protein JO166_04100 [Deltaproteobacteria bacterium]|nr:hypothetical protein [Deltaproteobacteria bacterium]
MSTAIATVLFIGALITGPRDTFADSFQRVFVGNFIGYSADPVNYFSVSGASSRGGSSASFYLEKALSKNSSISLLAGIERLNIETGLATGWDNLSFSYKHTIWSVPTDEFALALNPFFELPVRTPEAGAESHSRWGIELLAQKGLADLPKSLHVLRAAAMEGDVAWESKVTGAPDDLVSADAEIEYSIDYFDRYTCPGCAGEELRDFTPHLDLNYIQYTSAHRNISSPLFYLVPALAWLNSAFEINLGIEVALNRGSSSEGSVGFVWLVGVSLDDILPGAKWTPFN